MTWLLSNLSPYLGSRVRCVGTALGLTLYMLVLASPPTVQRAQSTTTHSSKVYGAYVLLGPSVDAGSAVAFARVLVDAGQEACPQLLGGPSPIPMTFRSNPHGFNVKVCEASVPFDQRLRVSWNDMTLPPIVRNPSRIVVMGDSGCKGSDCPGDEPATPFNQLAALAAKLEPPPQLIVHVGDYNYRGTKGTVTDKNTGQTLDVYDAGDNAPDDPECQLTTPYVSQNARFSKSPDSWSNWQADFFEPASPLLSKAPWVFARGNHELCSRGGPGWFYFLDASAEPSVGGTGQLQCPPQGGDAPPSDDVFKYLKFTEPRVINLADFRIIVIDSANACDGFAPNQTTARYQAQLEQVLREFPDDKTTWLASHRPVWGALQKKTPEIGEPQSAFPSYQSINHTLQRALAEALVVSGNTSLPADLKLLLSGHMHTFEALTFVGDKAESRPPQLVVGNSGVALEGSATDGTFNARIAGAPTRVVGVNEHGLLDIFRLESNGSWSGALVSASKEVLAQCRTSKLPESICTRCDASREIQRLLDDATTPDRAAVKIVKALGKADEACVAADFLASSRLLRRSVSFLLKAAQKGADTAHITERIVESIKSSTSVKIREAVEKAGLRDSKVEQAQRRFARASEKQSPKKVISLFRRSYEAAARAISASQTTSRTP